MSSFTSLDMRFNKLLQLIALPLSLLVFSSCSKDFDVNAEWKEIPVVYGLLNQNDTIHYLKITKAFLGEGNAMTFAKIADSSNYPPEELEVKIEGWNGSNLIQTIYFHDTLITTKDTGIFYAPDQLVYYSTAVLNELYTYKLFVKNTRRNFEVKAQTTMIKDFVIEKPEPAPATASFLPNRKTQVAFYPAEGGIRYGLTVKFHFLESINGGPNVEKVLDWLIFSDVKAEYSPGAQPVTRSIAGESFYTFLKSELLANPNIERVPRQVEFIFTVASPDLNTYMEVNEPSNTIIQERPSFSNITNGIGLFTSRYDNTKKRPIVVELSDYTKAELKVNPNTADLNF